MCDVPVDVQLSVVGQIVVNDERHLRHVQTSGPNVCGDQHSTAREKADHKHMIQCQSRPFIERCDVYRS